MSVLVVSDIHGSAYWCREIASAFAREEADTLVILGDILNHGPRNPFPRDYSPREVMDILNDHADRIVAVRGNCDSEVDQMCLDFPMMSDSAVLYVDGRRIFATHGHVYGAGMHGSPDNCPPLRPGDILLHGHTHVPACEKLENGVVYANPGSVSLPKEESWYGYILINDDYMFWKSFDGEVRIYMPLSEAAIAELDELTGESGSGQADGTLGSQEDTEALEEREGSEELPMDEAAEGSEELLVDEASEETEDLLVDELPEEIEDQTQPE